MAEGASHSGFTAVLYKLNPRCADFHNLYCLEASDPAERNNKSLPPKLFAELHSPPALTNREFPSLQGGGRQMDFDTETARAQIDHLCHVNNQLSAAVRVRRTASTLPPARYDT